MDTARHVSLRERLVSDDRLSAGNGDGCARDIARLIRRQHNVDRRELLRLAGTLHRHLLANSLTFSAGIVEGIRGVQIGPGATQFTLIPFSAKSCASPPVKF